MEYGLWINGRWQAGSGTVDVENPATGKTVAQVATAGEQEVNAAVAAAKAAFDDGRWSKATPGERSGVAAAAPANTTAPTLLCCAASRAA